MPAMYGHNSICADRMRNYFMYENKRRKKFVIEYPKIFATGRHWGTPKSRWGGR